MLDEIRIAVVIPARNEARWIEEVLLGLPDYVDDIIVIDDGSTDGTSALARGARPDVHVLRNQDCRGVGAAIVAGYQRARELGAGAVAVMAGDGQMDPRDLRAVLMPVVDGRADYVKGERLSHPEVRRLMPTARRRAGRVLGRLTAFATGLSEVRDSQCGYTAIGRRALEEIAWDELWSGYGYPNDLLSMLACAGLRVAQVPVRPVYRGEASGIRPWHVLIILGLLSRAAGRRLGLARAPRTTPSPPGAPAPPTSTETPPPPAPLPARARPAAPT